MRHVLVQVGVDRREIGERRLIQHFQNLKLDLVFGVDARQRIGERLDKRCRGQRVCVGLETRQIEQVADAAIESDQLVMCAVFNDADDVAGDHRHVHRLIVDERELAHVERGKIGLGLLGLKPLVDALAQALVELHEQIRALARKRGPCVPIELRFLLRLGRVAARHQHVADLVQHRREGREQALDRHVAAALENLGLLRRKRAARDSFWGGRVQARDGIRSRAWND